MAVRAFSFGGGVQSMACLVLAAEGRIDYRTFVFADVGADSEHPATMAYFEEYAKPYAERHGLDLLVVQKLRRDGSFESILEKLHRTQRSIDIPVRMQNGAPGRRSCTADYKIKPVSRWMKQHGATVTEPGIVGVGISLDEFERMRDSQIPYIRNEYPLVDLRIDRAECERIIRSAGLPVPPKSSCWFCPFHRPDAWVAMRHDEPELFAQAVELERMVNVRRSRLGLDDVWLTRFAMPLDVAIPAYEEAKATKDMRAAFKRSTGQTLPPGVIALTLFDADDGAHNCGPFTCAVGRGA